MTRLTAALADRYRIERELGAGGMATVYLAHDLKHDRDVAIKVLHPDLGEALGAERFLAEIRTTAKLQHPHILPLLDSGEADGQLYYVMPYLTGETLRARLDRERQLPIADALLIAREVADALGSAHAQGIVHRDIKPENILLQGGHAVVADFGIALAVQSAGTDRLTGTGLSLGTPHYMSPEQAMGERQLDARSDIYALGCVTYEMLAGEPPFTGTSAQAIIAKVMTEKPTSLRVVRDATPSGVEHAVMMALAKVPADRQATAAAFAAALNTTEEETAARSPVASDRRTPFWRWGALGLAAALLAGVLIARSWGGQEALAVPGRTIEVTREPGLELDPAISPDGQMIAYAAGPTTNTQIYVRQVSGGRTLQLTTDSTGNFRWPRWSPDGSQIAYQAMDGIYLMPALGGAPRLVTRVPERPAVREGQGYAALPLAGLSWAPDGTRLAFATAGGLYVVDLGTKAVTKFAGPIEPYSPAWSPDGSQIAFVSGNPAFVFGMVYFANVGTSSLWVVPVDGGPPRAITDEAALNDSPQWLPGGKMLYFVSDRGGSRDVYRLSLAGNEDPVRLTTGLDAQTITLSPDGRHLAFNRLTSSTNIASLPIPTTASMSAAGIRDVTTGRQTIEQVDVSRDGRWLVFDSDRGGNPDLYKMAVAGGEAIQLTTGPEGDFSPMWSADGTQIAFHRLHTGTRTVYTVKADGTGLTARPSGSGGALDPSWRPDGEALVAESRHPASVKGNFIVIPLGVLDTVPTPLPVIGDFADWSPRGDVIAFHAVDGIRIVAPDGGASQLLVSNAEDGTEAYYTAWSPDGRTLYYLARSAGGWMIRAIPRAGGGSRIIARFTDPSRQPLGYGFATDGRTFYLTIGSHESDVWVLELAPAGVSR